MEILNVACQAASVCSQLVVTVLRDITDPGQGLIAALLDDLQISHLNAGRSEIWDLELDLDRRLAFGVFALY